MLRTGLMLTELKHVTKMCFITFMIAYYGKRKINN
jgi:hypothetical protein